MQKANTKAIEKMDVKKPRTIAPGKAVDGKKVVEFVGAVKEELKRVEWTSKEELKSYTKIVLISTFLFGLAIYLADLLIQGFFSGFNFIVKSIAG